MTLARTCIKGVDLLDGTGRVVQPAVDLWIERGRLTHVGPTVGRDGDEADLVIDGTGHTVVPGLIEMHTHAADAEELPVFARNGITTIRFAGRDVESVTAVRRAAKHGGPRVLTCGPMLELPPAQHPEWALGLASPEDVRERLVPLLQADGLLRLDATISVQRTPPWLLKEIIEVSHEHGRPVVGQVDYTGAEEASELGIDQIDNTSRIFASREYPAERLSSYKTRAERLPLHFGGWATIDWELTKPIMTAMLENDVTYCPTLTVYETLLEPPYALLQGDRDFTSFAPHAMAAFRKQWDGIHAGFGDLDRENARRAVDNLYVWIRTFREQGGRVVAGTDLAFGGIMLHAELRNLAKVGMTMPEVIKAATHDAAHSLGCLDDLGTIAPGKRADLVLIPGRLNDLDDLDELRSPSLVLRDGQIVGGSMAATHAPAR